MKEYIVKKGDTLSAIAKQFGTTYQEIAKANGISDPNKISVGQKLNIDGSTATTAPSATSTAPSVKTSDATNTALNKVKDLESQKPGAFTYEIPQSSWQEQINDTINKILNREDFSYDLNGDALYQQYKDQYTTQGKMAMMNTMGQAQAMTGGYGNSYAQSVGQQAYQGYLQQLNDKVPELYQIALNQYNREGQDLKDLYALYTDMDEREYSRNMDKINMDYTVNRDAVTDWQNELNRADSNYWNLYGYDYQVGRDAVDDAWKQKEFDEAVRQFNASQKGLSGGSSSGETDSPITSIAKKMLDRAVNNIVEKANPTPDQKEYYADFDYNDWHDLFESLRQSKGSQTAELMVNDFITMGLLPEKYVVAATSGARGRSRN